MLPAVLQPEVSVVVFCQQSSLLRALDRVHLAAHLHDSTPPPLPCRLLYRKRPPAHYRPCNQILAGSQASHFAWQAPALLRTFHEIVRAPSKRQRVVHITWSNAVSKEGASVRNEWNKGMASTTRRAASPSDALGDSLPRRTPLMDADGYFAA